MQGRGKMFKVILPSLNSTLQSLGLAKKRKRKEKRRRKWWSSLGHHWKRSRNYTLAQTAFRTSFFFTKVKGTIHFWALVPVVLLVEMLVFFYVRLIIVTQDGETKISYLLSGTFTCGLQTKSEIHFSLMSVWNWVLWIENEDWLSNPLFKAGVWGEGLNHRQGRGWSLGECILFLLRSQSQGEVEGWA